MKKNIYITAFTIFGFLAQVLLHAMIELPIIKLMIINYEKFSLGLSWSQLMTIHHIGAVLLVILGLSFGFIQGKYWYQVIYIEKKYRRLHK